ncbi:MAG: preprotein translocase subunit SecE [Anaerolineales bacterium]
MNAKAEQQSSVLDIIKLVVAAGIVVAAIAAYYQFANESQLLRMIGVLVALAVGGAVALTSSQGRALWSFASEARAEVRKVIWPTRPETIQTTLAVIVIVIIVGLFLWAIDSILFWIVFRLNPLIRWVARRLRPSHT